MALKPLDIFKHLPKTNCKECGFPTCLAFAMQVALGKTELANCTQLSEESKKRLSQASSPPIRTITLGSEKSKVNLGGETVMFRHEKTFYNPPPIGILLSEGLSDEEIDRRLEKFCSLIYERVGLTLQGEVIAVEDKGQGRFLATVKKAFNTGKCLLLISPEAENLIKAAEICQGTKPLLFLAGQVPTEKLAQVAKATSLPIVVSSNTLEGIAKMTAVLSDQGVTDLVIYPEVNSVGTLLKNLVLIRRAAIHGGVRQLGYPVLAMPARLTDDLLTQTMYACLAIAKYASLVILSDLSGEILFPLLLERLNLFTDPQRPLATVQGLYEIGQPGRDAPLLVTSNFSLTYFIVSGEIQNSRVPAYLLVVDTEGLSVLTAWAADKLNAEKIATLVKQTKIEEKIDHRTLILPGVVAGIAGELEEELPGWKILLGPREAAYIPVFLKNWKP
ncbi:MAG: acetyl-CoA decarbonylase/synthase complex subunit gamma [Candidatus Omnitrophica bacterium]|nr:acetyl-CoA decarbonylase/synthase complex subunit gamma [Candidatus Omnitrophota bacterium]